MPQHWPAPLDVVWAHLLAGDLDFPHSLCVLAVRCYEMLLARAAYSTSTHHPLFLCVHSALGRADGDVYRALLDMAKVGYREGKKIVGCYNGSFLIAKACKAVGSS